MSDEHNVQPKSWAELPLSEDHARMLADSGITPEIAEARGYRTIGRDEVEELGRLEPTPYGRASRHSGLLVPSRGFDGTVIGHQLRPNAELIGEDGSVKKYVSPFREPAVIDCPPTMLDALRDPSVPLMVTEGAKKADAAAARGLLCVALRGVDCWTTGQGTALEQWREIPLQGRRVAIAYDSDLGTNPNVRKAAKRLAKYLTRSRGAVVSFIIPPAPGEGKNGLDDWLVANPGADPWDLAVTTLPEEESVDGLDPDKPQILATDLHIADAMVEMLDGSLRFIADEEVWSAYRDGVWNSKAGLTIARSRFQDFIRTVQAYTESRVDGQVVRNDATTWLYSSVRINAVLAHVAANRQVHLSGDEMDTNPYLFNVGDGTIDLKTGLLLPHRASDLITMGSTVLFDGNADRTEFDKFLREVLPDEETRAFVKRLFGMAMIGEVLDHVFPVFQGVGRNGKGTLLRLVQAAFGSYYSGISKNLLIETKYEEHSTIRTSLYKRRLVTAEEVKEDSAWNAASIKELTGGDDITGRRMRQDEFTFRPSHTLILAANHWPKVSAKDEAFWARVRKVPFNTVFTRPDPDIEKRIRAHELPGILHWLVEGCQEYLKYGLGEPAAIVAATAGIRAESDPMHNFLDDHVEVTHNGDDMVVLATLYDLYTAWCRSQSPRVTEVAKKSFGADVAKAAGIALPKKHGKANTTTFFGMRLVDGQGATESGLSPLGAPTGPTGPDEFADGFAKGSPAGGPGAGAVAPDKAGKTTANSSFKGGEPKGEHKGFEKTAGQGNEANLANSANPFSGDFTGDQETTGFTGEPGDGQQVNQLSGASQADTGPDQFAEFAEPVQGELELPGTGDREYTKLAPADFTAPATEAIGEGVVVFDIESASAEEVFTSGPEFVRIFGYQTGDQLRVTEDVREMVELVANARTLVGHNIMNLDVLPFALNHGLDIHQAAEDGKFWDTQLVEVLLNPPPYWMEPKQVPAKYSLDALGQEKFEVGKSHDLRDLVKKHGGRVAPKGKPGTEFAVIPTDDEEYVRYCAADVDLTTRIARTQRATPAQVDYIRREHRIAAIAAQISMNGFKVDQELLHERIAQGQAKKAELRERLVDLGATFTKKDGSPAKVLTEADRLVIEGLFNQLGVELPRTPKGNAPSLRKETFEELREEYADRADVIDLIDMVGQFNGVRTVYQTALDNLRPDGRVHPNINMYQSTGRWSVKDPGMTVFGKRGGRHIEREIFIPDEGEVIIAADLSQVDARAIAAWSQCPDYMRMFDPGMDIHAEVAQQMFGDRARRDDAKALSHGYNYGLGFNKLARKHGPELAQSFLDTMSAQFPRLVEWKDEIRRESMENDFRLDNGWGKPLVIDPDSNYTQAPALVGQSAARDIMMQGLLNLPRWVLPMLRVQVHDEIVLSVPEDRVDEIKKIVVDALSFPWRPFDGARGHEQTVEILADSGKHGANWGAVYAK